MKAKLYIFGEKFEIKLSDDTVHTPGKKETKEAFLDRIKEIVYNEHLDDVFEVIEIDEAVVALNDPKVLKEALEGGATGLQKLLIENALLNSPIGKEVKAARAKVVGRTTEEAKASPEYVEALAQVGKFVSFSPFKSVEVFEGKIAGIALNKTNTIIYYTVVEANSKRRCCGVLNESVQFIEEPEAFKKAVKVEKEAKPAKAKAATKAEKAAAEAAHSVTDTSDAAPKTDLEGNAVGGDLM